MQEDTIYKEYIHKKNIFFEYIQKTMYLWGEYIHKNTFNFFLLQLLAVATGDWETELEGEGGKLRHRWKRMCFQLKCWGGGEERKHFLRWYYKSEMKTDQLN